MKHLRKRAFVVSVAVVAVAAAGLGSAAGASPHYGHHAKEERFKRPKLNHGLLVVEGTNDADAIAVRLQAADSNTLQVDVGDDGSADFSFQRRKVARIIVDARGGDDRVRIDESNGFFTDSIPAALIGGDGNDTLAGGVGTDLLLGGDGNDTVDGNGGNDLAFLGAGDDTFVWDPGDGSDSIEGDGGTDTMLFNGNAAGEQVDLSANGSRLRFFRNPGAVTMDTHGVETVDFDALGGSDAVTVNDLAGTDVAAVNLDLGSDGQQDRVTVNGSNRNDAINVSGDAGGVKVNGLAATVSIQHQEPTDGLTVSGLGGDDTISATGLAAGAIALALDGGTGNDTVAGGAGVETLLGGDGNDTIDGNGGNDSAALGAGDDTFVWDPGDGSDSIEGQDGTDTMLFNGAAGAEKFDLSANGNRLKFARDLGNITMDTHGVEQVDVNALGGADLLTVNDLTGTDVDLSTPTSAATGRRTASSSTARTATTRSTSTATQVRSRSVGSPQRWRSVDRTRPTGSRSTPSRASTRSTRVAWPRVRCSCS